MDALPTELLEEIFSIGASVNRAFYQSWNEPVQFPSLTHEAVYRSECCPFQWLVTSVCRRWRTIALAIPSLWTTVRIELINSPEMMAEYLRRSRGKPLDIHFEADECYEYLPSAENLEAIMDVLLTANERLRRLTIASVWSQPLVHATSCLEHIRVPNLEYLEIHIFDDYREPGLINSSVRPMDCPRSIFSGGAPRLLEVRFNSLTFTRLPDDACRRIKTVYLCPHSYAGPNNTSLRYLAERLSNLTFVSFSSGKMLEVSTGSSWGNINTTRPGAGSILMGSSLRTLHFARIQDVVLDLISAPSLEVLQIDDLFHHQSRDVLYVSRLMSNPGLHRAPGELPADVSRFSQVRCARFGVAGDKMLTKKPSAIASVYKLFPELQTLVLKGHMSPDLCQLLEPLTLESVFPAARAAGVLAPHLEHLVLLGDWHFCKVVEALKSLIPLRQDAYVPLKRLTLQKPYGPLPSCCFPFDEKVAELLEAGLECELLSTNDTEDTQQYWIQHPREAPLGAQR